MPLRRLRRGVVVGERGREEKRAAAVAVAVAIGGPWRGRRGGT